MNTPKINELSKSTNNTKKDQKRQDNLLNEIHSKIKEGFESVSLNQEITNGTLEKSWHDAEDRHQLNKKIFDKMLEIHEMQTEILKILKK